MSPNPLSIELVKSHLGIDRNDQDHYLRMLADAAVVHFHEWSGHLLLPSNAEPDSLNDDQVPLYTSIAHGLLQLIAYWYENQEIPGNSASPADIPASVYSLWSYDIDRTGDSHSETE